MNHNIEKLEKYITISAADKCVVINTDNLNMLFLSHQNMMRALNSLPKMQEVLNILNRDRDLVKKGGCLREDIEINPQIIVTYQCNFNCDYCYEKGHKRKQNIITHDHIVNVDKYFDNYCDFFSIEKKYGVIGLTGGEPLLAKNKNIISDIFSFWCRNKFSINTNASYLDLFFDMLPPDKTDLRISLDGTKSMHLKRRKIFDSYMYERIVDNIDVSINSGYNVSLLAVFDPDFGLEYLNFIEFLDNRDWLGKENVTVHFLPLITHGADTTNYEYMEKTVGVLHEMLKIDSKMQKINFLKVIPCVSKIKRSLYNSNYLNIINPYRCNCLFVPDYTFTPDGKVLACILSNIQESIMGYFYPFIEVRFDRIFKLIDRNVFNLSKCAKCKYRFFCGGGCFISAFFSTGDLHDSYCGYWEKIDKIPYFDEFFYYSNL